MTTFDPDRAASLQAAKLRALTRDRVAASCAASPFPGGAALVDGPVGWVLPGEQARRGLGAVLAWALRSGVAEVHVVVDDPAVAGVLARQAVAFAPAPSVWRVVGTDRVAATPVPLVPPAPAPDAPELRALLREAGLEVVDEDGMALGELRGLEVARIVAGADGRPELGVGVGRFDREVGEMTFGHLAPPERLARVVDVVAGYRRPGAPPHPLNQLVPERWLRAGLVDEPALVGAMALRPVPSARGRANLLEAGRAAAVGTDLEGRPLVVVCSSGVDLDLVPGAADDRALHAPGARLVLAVPARDALPVTHRLAAALADPAEVFPIDGDWRIPWA
ncbi:MAG TPA: hypothetical protein VEW93_06000 [Acidimicrobiales bacterium]|nr:hypothetical protein [Acidimicrobiales bacterium]